METRNLLFNKNKDEKLEAMKKILAHVDQVMDSSHGVELVLKYPDGCKYENGVVVKLFEASYTYKFIAKARHKNTCGEMKAQLN